MIEEGKLTTYYSEIANKLDEMIPCKWERIVLYAEEIGNARFATFYFYTENGEIHHWGDISEEYNVNRMLVSKGLNELRQINKRLWLEFNDSDEETWYSFTFDINSDWQFKVKFGYEKNDELSGLEKEIRWGYDELGLIPKERVEKTILKNYLEGQGKEVPVELQE